MLVLCFPATVWAQFYAMPFAGSNYQYTSNVFALPSSAGQALGVGTALSDHILEEYAGADALYNWSLQEFYANVEARHFGYDHFGSLSHDEYLVHGGLKWKLGYLLDGVLDYRRERSMVEFLEFRGTQLFLQLQSIMTARANLQVTPAWQLESQGEINDEDSPRPELPDLSLTEDSIHEGLHYLGVTRLSAGLDAIFLQGRFHGDEFVIAPRYDQTTVEAAAKYAATGFSSFDAAVGYTRRNQENAPSIGGTTGMLAYQRQLTARTSVTLNVSRTFNTYLTYGGAEFDTGVALSVNWNPTEKIAVTPGYQWTYSTYPGANLAANAGERLDHYQVATLSAKYQVLDWLSLRAFGHYETRNSNVGAYSFNDTLFGLDVEVRLPGQADQPYVLSVPQ